MGLTKTLKKEPITKQNQKKERKKTINPPFLGIFTFIVLLPIDDGVVVCHIILLCSRKWLLSYAPPCLQNLKTKFTTSLLNGTTNEFIINPFFY